MTFDGHRPAGERPAVGAIGAVGGEGQSAETRKFQAMPMALKPERLKGSEAEV